MFRKSWKDHYLVYWLIFYLLICIALFMFMPNELSNSFAGYLAKAATVGLLPLTAFYVIYVGRQITELKRQRELNIQPLPKVTIQEAHLRPPRVTISPPENGEVSLVVDIVCKVVVKNVGNGASILNDIWFKWVGEKIRKERYPHGVSARRVSVIEQGEQVEFKRSIRDSNFDIVNEFRRSHQGELCSPADSFKIMIRTNVLYKNILSAAFLASLDYIVFPANKYKAQIAKWVAAINSFRSTYAKEIALAKSEFERDVGEAYQLFGEIREKFNKSIDLSVVPLEIKPYELSFSVRVLEKSEEEIISKTLFYGRPLLIPAGELENSGEKGSSPSPKTESDAEGKEKA